MKRERNAQILYSSSNFTCAAKHWTLCRCRPSEMHARRARVRGERLLDRVAAPSWPVLDSDPSASRSHITAISVSFEPPCPHSQWPFVFLHPLRPPSPQYYQSYSMGALLWYCLSVKDVMVCVLCIEHTTAQCGEDTHALRCQFKKTCTCFLQQD